MFGSGKIYVHQEIFSKPKRQKVPLTFLYPTEEKSPEKSKHIKIAFETEKFSLNVPLAFLNSSKGNYQKNRYQNHVFGSGKI